MYITPEQLHKRLIGQDKSGLKIQEKIKTTDLSGPKYTVQEKSLIGSLTAHDTQQQVAKVFDLTHTTVGLAARGIDNPRAGVDQTLKDKVELITQVTKEGAKNEALNSLMASLGIVKDTVGNLKNPVDASRVARNMSSIVRDLEPKDLGGSNMQVNVVIHAPVQKTEKIYETIDV